MKGRSQSSRAEKFIMTDMARLDFIQIEQRFKPRPVVVSHKRLNPGLEVAMGRRWIVRRPEPKKPKAEVDVVARAVVGLLQIQDNHRVRAGEVPRSSPLVAAVSLSEFIESQLDGVAHAHRSIVGRRYPHRPWRYLSIFLSTPRSIAHADWRQMKDPLAGGRQADPLPGAAHFRINCLDRGSLWSLLRGLRE